MQKIICIPGLGGHASVFAEYADLLPDYDLRFMEFVNRAKALADARQAIVSAGGPVVLFCHCYSAQMGIQLAADFPDKVSHLVFLEPFFSEFQPWMKVLRPISWTILRLMEFSDKIGLRRRRLTYQPDYIALAKYPIYIQPIFDMRWQNLTDYFDKCYDILTYKLPPRVATPTLMMFSPNGFSRSPSIRDRLQNVFVSARIEEMRSGTHNVITMGSAPVAASVREYLENNQPI